MNQIKVLRNVIREETQQISGCLMEKLRTTHRCVKGKIFAPKQQIHIANLKSSPTTAGDGAKGNYVANFSDKDVEKIENCRQMQLKLIWRNDSMCSGQTR